MDWMIRRAAEESARGNHPEGVESEAAIGDQNLARLARS